MAEVGYGAMRQVWLAPADDHDAKVPFLIRDDAYTRSDATIGRTIGLGEPVTTGPNSSWYQTNWSGGAGQRRWSDKVMFSEGTLNATDRQGKLTNWPGWSFMFGPVGDTNKRITAMVSGPRGIEGNDIPLYFAVGERFYRYNALTGTTDLLHSFDADVNDLSRLNATGGNFNEYLAICLANGKFYRFETDTDELTYDDPTIVTTVPTGRPMYASVSFFTAGGAKQYVLVGDELWSRDHAAGTVTWTLIKKVTDSDTLRSICVWNGRLWIGGRARGVLGKVYSSDGVTVVHAFDLPHSYVMSMQPHYGSLYIGTLTYDFSSGDSVEAQRIWKYNGSSLTTLFDTTTDPKVWGAGLRHDMSTLASNGRFLAWGMTNGNYLLRGGSTAGLMLYDAEEDAIHIGPSLGGGAGLNTIFVDRVIAWAGTFVAAFYNSATTNYALAHVRRSGKVSHGGWPVSGGFAYMQSQDSVQEVLSSSFDGDFPELDKTFLGVTVRYKSTPFVTFRVYLRFDDNANAEYLLGEWTDTGASLNLRTKEFTIADILTACGRAKGKTLAYRLEIEAPHNYDGANEEVPHYIDSVKVDYIPTPARRQQWRIRAICDDEQRTLDGTVNPITTREAQVDYLYNCWADGVPVAYWDARPHGTEPDGDPDAYVQTVNFTEQGYRVNSTEDTVVSEVSLTLIEVL